MAGRVGGKYGGDGWVVWVGEVGVVKGKIGQMAGEAEGIQGMDRYVRQKSI